MTCPTRTRHAQSGRTIVELMITVAIGMAVVLGVVALYSSASRAARSSVQLSDVESQFVLALRVLKQSVLMAGYGDLPGDATAVGQAARSALLQGPIVVGCEDGRFAAPAAGNFTCVPTAGAGDALMVRFQSDKATGPVQGALRDCLGGQQPVLVNAFWRDGADLMCFGGALGNAQPMIGDVEEFEVLYGVDEAAFAASASTPDAGPERVTRLLRADQVAALDATGFLNPWDYVVSVQVCLRIATAQAGTSLARDVTFNRCPATTDEAMLGTAATGSATDGRMRRTVVQTYVLRNRSVVNASRAGAT